MIKYKVGDKIKVIDDNTHGIITQLTDDGVVIEDEHGFDTTYSFREILPDVGMEEEIEEVEVKTKKSKKKKSKPKKFKEFKETPATDDVRDKAELRKLIDDNFAKNSDQYREKLEERYKKEIKVSKKRKGTFVLDLHYGQLENFSAQLPTHHILKRQINAAINGIEKAKNESYKKIILIHGKGKGVLEAEVKKYLDDKGYTYYDADFRQYKLGATEIEL